MKKIRTSLFIAVLGLLAFSSCITTKLIMDPDLPMFPKPALLTGLTIGMENDNSEGDLLGAAINIMQNMDLSDFGADAQEAITAFLSENGFEVFVDPVQAKREDSPFNTGDGLAALGYWVHPDTSAITAHHFVGWALGFNPQEHMAKVKGDSDTDYFVYSDLRIYKNQGIFLLVHPTVVFTIAVVDGLGNVVFEAQALGEGNYSLFFSDTSKENLTVALNDAIASLYELE